MLYILVAVVLICALMYGSYSLGKRSAANPLSRGERRELESYRAQEYELVEKASEAATLGDDFGVRALAIIRNHKTERKKGASTWL